MVDAAGLKKNWEAVARHGDQVPLFFYSTLFLTHPYTRGMFPVSMAAQRDKLVGALGRIVSNVDNLDAVIPVLEQLGRDHRKFAVVRDHYPAVSAALISTLEHFSGPDWSVELARDWEAAFAVVANVMIEAAESDAARPAWWEATVVAHELRTVDLAVLRIRPHRPLEYRPGQAISLETPVRPRLWRYYSPASIPGEDGAFELHVRLVDGGPVSTALVHATQVQDVLRLGPPVGERLTLDCSEDRDLVLVAGGTGLAPMKALVQHLVAIGGGGRRVHLFWGARFHHELYDLPALHALTDEPDWIRLVPCVSEEAAMGGFVEAGTAVEVALRHGPWPDHELYVCGSPPMVRGTVEALEQAGVRPDRIHVDDLGTEETQP